MKPEETRPPTLSIWHVEPVGFEIKERPINGTVYVKHYFCFKEYRKIYHFKQNNTPVHHFELKRYVRKERNNGNGDWKAVVRYEDGFEPGDLLTFREGRLIRFEDVPKMVGGKNVRHELMRTLKIEIKGWDK